MLRKCDFKRLKKAPANYIPGISRGDTGFITRLNLSTMTEEKKKSLQNFVDNQKLNMNKTNKEEEIKLNDRDYDDWNGYKTVFLKSDKITKEDLEHDKILDNIEKKLSEKTNKKRKTLMYTKKQSKEENNNKKINLKEVFEKNKKNLSSLTEEDWLNIPEVVPKSKNTNKNEKYTPISDSIYLDQLKKMEDKNTQNSIPLEKNPEKNLSLYKISGKSTNLNNNKMKIINKIGYMTQLEEKTDKYDIDNINKARLLYKSLRESNPRNEEGWLGSFRIEKLNGKIDEGIKFLKEGLNKIPNNENLWVELILEKRINSEKLNLINKSLRFVPDSEKIWELYINLTKIKNEKKLIIQKALKYCNKIDKFWKMLIDLSETDQERKLILAESLNNCKNSIDLWLGYAKFNDYNKARKILNKANKIFNKSEIRIWIAAANLEEIQGSDEKIIFKIISRGFKNLYKLNNFSYDKEIWFKQCVNSEKINCLKCCEVILNKILDLEFDKEIEEDFLKEKIFEDFGFFKEFECFYSAEVVLKYGDKVNQKFGFDNIFFLEKLFFILKNRNFDNVLDEFERAISFYNNNKVFTLILNFLKNFWESKKIDEKIYFEYFEKYSLKCIEKIKNQNLIKKIIMDLINYYLYNIKEIDKGINLVKDSKNFDLYILSLKLELRKDFFENEKRISEIINKKIENIKEEEALEKLLQLKISIFEKLNLQEEKIKYLKNLLKKNPDALSVKYFLAKIYYKNSRDFEARVLLNNLLTSKKIKENEYKYIYNLLIFEKPNKDIYKNLLINCLKKYKENKNFLILDLENNKQNKKKLAFKILKKFGNCPEIYISISKIYFKDFKFEKSKFWLLKAQNLDFNNIDILAYLYVINFFVLKNYEEAEKIKKTLGFIFNPKGFLYKKILGDKFLNIDLENEISDIFDILVDNIKDEYNIN